jgi:poly-gamma-glutamate synthesis protein (capsule biosynthesis protein)
MNPEKVNKTQIIFGGDVMLGRTVALTSVEESNTNYVFEKIVNVLRGADIAFVNLENPVLDECQPNDDLNNLRLCTTPELSRSLADSGIDVVTLANNHSRDYGNSGLHETIRHLSRLGIESTGLRNLVVKENNNIKFGFMGFDFVSQEDSEEDYELTRKFKDKVDVLIVGVHWGGEFQEEPNWLQKRQAKRLVNAGVDTIVGHHPHVIQPKDTVNGVPVYYSLGNLVFDQMWDVTRRGLMVRQIYDGKVLVQDELIETYMENYSQPAIS